jgi:signal transduction histidine kinase
MGIRARVAILAVAPATLLACALAYYFTSSRIADAEEALRRLGQTTAQHLAASAEYGVVTGNRRLLEALAGGAVNDTQIDYVSITDSQLWPLAVAGTLPNAASATHDSAAAANLTARNYVFRAPILPVGASIDDPFDAERNQAAGSATRPLGWVTVAMSHSSLDQSRSRMLLTGLAIVLAGLALTAGFAVWWGGSISRPIRALSGAVAALEHGHLGARVEAASGGELLRLQSGFNRMAESLQTHQAELQKRIREATADLEEKRKEAEQANQAKSSFLAAVSHDLRQPMHAVGLFAAALRARVTTEDQIELVQRIEDSVSALQVMFDSLLNISRLDAGVIEPSMEPCDLRQILSRVQHDYQPMATEKGLYLRWRARDAWGMSDPVLLGRLIGNLVANAVRYTERGGILVACRRRGDAWLIQVWDSGIGIPREHLPHVFEEYYQVGNRERNRARGVGLGLAIVQKIARALGHGIQVRSRPGKGSVFGVLVPASSERAIERRAAPQREIGRFAGEMVMVVDDDADVRESLARLLAGWGLSPFTADGAEAALARLGDPAGPPKLVICDYRLPNMSGIELLQALRKESGLPIPTLIVTGDTAADSIAALEDSGVPVLHKPVRPAKLRALISALLAPAPG